MKNTLSRLLQASERVFSQKGYILATTKEIASEAGLSEMTLFRRFESKQQLFLATIRFALNKTIDKQQVVDLKSSLHEFVYGITYQRLTNVSQHLDLFRMLIKETMNHRITAEYDIIVMMKKEMTLMFDEYQHANQTTIESEEITRLITSFVLQHIILDHQIPFHEMQDDQQKKYINSLFNYTVFHQEEE